MKINYYKYLFLLFFLFTIIGFSQQPNDCVNSITVCGNTNLNLDVSGVGISEVVNNTCGSGENNSVWLKVVPNTSGTLGFTLTPSSTDITEDFDFFVFGPNVSCGNLGTAIRCSTTNPQNAGLANNLTGMNAAETDTSEGPGNDGNSFVKWLTVNANDVYYIMIDRPIGNSSFSLEWIGTATFSEPPTNELPNDVNLEIEGCDNNNDGIAIFNLTQFESDLVETQIVNVDYFDSITNAEINTSPILNPTEYNGTAGTVYVRLTDVVSNCYSVFDINLIIRSIDTNTPEDLYNCTEIVSTIFDLAQERIYIQNNLTDLTVTFHVSQLDAENNVNFLPDSYTNTSNPQIIYVRIEDTIYGCVFIESFTLNIQNFFSNTEPNFGNETLLYCEDMYPETITLSPNIENNDINDFTYLWSTGETTPSIDVSLSGIYSVVLRNSVGCTMETSFTVNGSSVFNSTEPNFKEETIYYCLENYPETITLFSNIENNDTTNFTFEWLPNLENTPDIQINETGDYTLNVYNLDGCFDSRTIHVLPSESATINDVYITDTRYIDRVSIEIFVEGQGDYIFGLDIDPLQIEDDTLFQEENTFDNVLYGEHIITIKDINGCSLVQKTIILLEYPKFITPNGDGKYDTWNINNINTSEIFSAISDIVIFDRYGKIMAKIKPNGLGWDGKYNGEIVPPDDYWFVVTLKNYKGELIQKKGHFSVN